MNALGASYKGRLMLEHADLAAVICSSQEDRLRLSKPHSSVLYRDSQGAEGWQEAIDEIFKRINTGYSNE